MSLFRSNLFSGATAERLDAPPGCKFLNYYRAMVRLLDSSLPLIGPTTDAEEDETVGVSLVVVAVVAAAKWPNWPSTSFLEQRRPLFMCRSQYFWSANASLEQRHFFPSVLRPYPASTPCMFAPLNPPVLQLVFLV